MIDIGIQMGVAELAYEICNWLPWISGCPQAMRGKHKAFPTKLFVRFMP
jgi:hypothetical protein